MENKQFISQLFLENSQFILVGLTGRTGSGCTTTANILESKKPNFPEPEHLNGFYKGLDVQRYKIVKKYAEQHWSNFYSIKVSDLISTYILTLSPEHLAKFICGSSEHPLDENQVYTKLKTGVFSNNRLVSNYKDLIFNLLEHSKDLDVSEKEANAFIRILTLIRKFTRDFKTELDEIRHGLYVSTYQACGNSIRKTGSVQNAYDKADFDPTCVFHLPETINRVIKMIRKVTKNKAYIVIDAIRNPYEAKFFKDRYAAFHLVSINAPDEHRSKYMQKLHKFSSDQIDTIEKIESGKVKGDFVAFTNQNVKKCIEISDIHLFNPKNEFDNNNILKAQIVWYVALMQHPGLVPPSSMERVMQVAYTMKMNSGCISRQVGAVVTDASNSIKSVGWNDVAKGQIPCSMRSLNGLIEEFNPVAYSNYERNNQRFRIKANEQLIKIKEINAKNQIFEGHNLSYCFKDIHNSLDDKGNQVHTRALHAEENAFLQLTKYGSSGIEGGKLYTTASPCELCAKKAYQLGMSEIIFIDPYPGIAQEHIINIGDNAPELIQFRGAIGKAYHRLYEQIIPIKDELSHMIAL
ncbi:deoxycytidylate deaminase [Vibrio vulnificus]|uniref:anti-phage dCTP deaminase n=1 Tax=Vibrio vulnificus TaxID=672 RepID=UPI0005F0D138|nr:anti-phage dCTP deaminase [Vibrio vulnificus]EIO3978557.1 deoxycytidylate deaminase [Vibrio vulnificus]EIU7747681.1 deoxycytidylate deaminase [Vibrio vulnificus]EJN6716931.1 deoxycytidylate deaminase [Vibrio vulnificus]EJN6718120.1 deoxycytidylate deaminase [Vibrio vulnificus]EJQ9993521.1 deoxycytidylate deaminase [Vibrio vulnificus]